MVMDQQYQDHRKGSAGSGMCLVCGRQGGNTIVVTSVHSFVSASGTSLSDFLVKVVGEDPCYSVSEVICQQCFVLLDRLDAYQARAAEIHSHLTSRYKDTKLELLGHRKRMSDLIASSLSSVDELRHGTTLNVSNELTITVMQDDLPKKISSYRSENLFGYQERKGSFPEDLFSRLISQKMKRRRGPLASRQSFLNKRRKQSPQKNSNNSNCDRNQNRNNNNNISYAKKVKSYMYANQQQNVSNVSNVSNVNRAGDLPDVPREDDSDDESETSKDDGSVSDASAESGDENSKEKGKDNDSSSDSSSSSSEDDGSEDDDDDSQKEVRGSQEEDDKEDSKSSDEGEDGSDSQSQRPESSLSQKSKEDGQDTPTVNSIVKETPIVNEISLVKVKSEVEEVSIDEHQIKEENAHNSTAGQIQLPSGVNVPPQVAEAMLMQSPLATSLLQSFLATSLWFGSPDNKPGTSQSKPKDLNPDDVTREMLAVAAGSTKDKKKRQELKNTGQSYINTKGKLVNAKQVWPQDCSRCPLKCSARISEVDRQMIFGEYWGLADYNLQRGYLAAHMQREEKLGPSGLLRTVILYFLTLNDRKLQVCRQFFLKTLDVSEKASRIVLEKMVRGELGTDVSAPSPSVGIRPTSAQGNGQESPKDHNDASNLSNEDCKSEDL